MNLWAVTGFFNPQGYRSRLVNYRCFRRHLPVPLLTVEWSVEGRFQLGDEEADRLIRCAGGDLMWQKERLLMIAEHNLPDACEALLLVDADVLLPERHWCQELTERLVSCPVVQPFREVHHVPPLPPDRLNDPTLMATLQSRPLMYLSRQSFADRCRHGERSPLPPTIELDVSSENHRELRRLAARPAYGHAWGVRRDWLRSTGIYEGCVAGSGDLAFAMACSGHSSEFCRNYPLNEAQQADYLRWAAKAWDEAGPMGLDRVGGVLLHLFHGHLGRRNYRRRLEVLAACGFDPARDLRAEPGRPFSWSCSGGRSAHLRRFFASYFRDRAEDEDSFSTE